MDIFDNNPPENKENLKTLFDFPPTTMWQQKSSKEDPEDISIKIIKESPTENKWLFTANIQNKEEKESHQLTFNLSLVEKEIGEDKDKKTIKEWEFDVLQKSGVFKDLKNNLDEILEQFNIATFAIQGKSTNKYSPSFEKELLSKKSRNDNDIEKEAFAVESKNPLFNKHGSYKI